VPAPAGGEGFPSLCPKRLLAYAGISFVQNSSFGHTCPSKLRFAFTATGFQITLNSFLTQEKPSASNLQPTDSSVGLKNSMQPQTVLTVYNFYPHTNFSYFPTIFHAFFQIPLIGIFAFTLSEAKGLIYEQQQ
jgi:hypothetical protein